jgi:dipeptidyl aminopeptidase/acylaminoacyl peptidase
LINGEKGVVFAASMDRARSKMAFLYGDFTDPGQLYVRDLSSGKEKMLTRFNRDFLDKITLGEVEEVWFKGPDANDLQGWILKPPGFDASKKYPSVLEVHGGPLTQYGFFFMHEFYAIAAQVFVVYFCNPRGGRGYGEKHAQAISGNWGDRDWADISAFTDYVEKLPYIDSARMGITGGSYGGYMTVWAIGHTTRYKAAVSQRCVSNFVSMWGSSDFNWSFEQELNNNRPLKTWITSGNTPRSHTSATLNADAGYSQRNGPSLPD